MIQEPIIMTTTGFEITSYSKEYLATLGSKVFLRCTGYLNQPSIKRCLKNNPLHITDRINASIKFHKLTLLNVKCLKNEEVGIELYLVTLTLSKLGGYTLYLKVNKPDYYNKTRNILHKTIDECF